MGREHTLDKIQRVFFEGASESTLTPIQQEQIRRYRAAFSVWLDKPIMSDSHIRDFLMREFGVGRTQAYSDINNLKYLLGNIRNAGKEWQRYKADQLVSDAIAMLEPREIEEEVPVKKPKKKVAGFMAVVEEDDHPATELKKKTIYPGKTDVLIAEAKIKAAKALVSIHKLNKDEGEQMPWDEIIPQGWEATTDPSVMGIKSIPNVQDRIEKLKKKYNQDIEIEDAEFTDVSEQ